MAASLFPQLAAPPVIATATPLRRPRAPPPTAAPTAPAFADASALSTSVQGSYTLTLTANDGLNPAVTSTAQLTVANAPIVVGAITGLPTAPVAINTSVTANATFTDPSPADSHAATIDWGDGNTSPTTVNETAGSGTGWITGSHTYAADGVYTVTVTVGDGE